MLTNISISLLLILNLFSSVYSIGVSTGICYGGCSAVVVACYAAAGAVFGKFFKVSFWRKIKYNIFIGTVTAGVGTAPAIIGINHFYIVFDLLIEFFLNNSMQHRVWSMYENLYGCNCFYALIKIMIA
jgi:hypothetical protein